MMFATEREIQRVYQDKTAAQEYIDERFASELNLLLHDRQVAAVKTVTGRLGSGRILELAPGPGRVTRDVQQGGTLVCLDFNEAMIQIGREACKQKRQFGFVAMDLIFLSAKHLILSTVSGSSDTFVGRIVSAYMPRSNES